MRRIGISDPAGTVRAVIAPDYGGMPVSLTVGGREVLHLDEKLLSLAPMLAGGMPVLFPFSSRTHDDSYRLDGGLYHMPFHGLVKNAAFAVKNITPDSLTVGIDSVPSEADEHYPFAHRLSVTYRVALSTLEVEAEVVNHSPRRLPHGLGWHPFFLASDKKRLRFTHHMKQRFDYVALKDGPAPEGMDLSEPWDDVLFDPEIGEFTLENPLDGYRVICRFDASHPVLVVCTTTGRSVCLEPWCSLPDSINSGRFLQWVEPGGVGRHRISLELSQI